MIIRHPVRYFLVLLCCLMFTACGGGGGGTTPPADTNCVLGDSKIGECKL